MIRNAATLNHDSEPTRRATRSAPRGRQDDPAARQRLQAWFDRIMNEIETVRDSLRVNRFAAALTEEQRSRMANGLSGAAEFLAEAAPAPRAIPAELAADFER